jgi:hypothetical protein
MWTTPIYQVVFRRLLPRLGYQSAIWAVAHRLCRMDRKILHEGVRFIEQGVEPDPKAKKKRAQMLARALRKLEYEVTITPINLAIALFSGRLPHQSQLRRDLENRSVILSATVVGRTVQLSGRVENYAGVGAVPIPPPVSLQTKIAIAIANSPKLCDAAMYKWPQSRGFELRC